MKVTKLTRAYSRSQSFKRPDGTEMWVRHEASIEVEPGEDETLAEVDAGMEEIVRKEVGASIKAEKDKIMASFAPKERDEPFPSARTSTTAMPKL